MSQTTRRVGIRELKAATSEVIRQVRERQSPIEITYRGEVVAKIVPVKSPAQIAEDRRAREERWQRLSEEATRLWPEGISAVEAVSEGRSRLEQPAAAVHRTVEDRLAREERRRLLAAEIGKEWSEDVSAVDAIRDIRDDGW